MADTIWVALPCASLLLDSQDRIILANPAAEQVLNTSLKSLKGQSLKSLLFTEIDLSPYFQRARADQITVSLLDVKAGSRHDPNAVSDIQINAVLGDDGQIVVVILPAQTRANSPADHQVQTAAQSAVGLAAMLAHEIKNPLAGITGAAQLLSMTLDTEEKELTELIVLEARRILTLLSQVEQFGDVMPPQAEAVNIHDILDRAQRSSSLGFAQHMNIQLDYDPSLPPVLGDADLLIQVFQNLLKNAAEAANPGSGIILIKTYYASGPRRQIAHRRDGNLPIQIEISDDGRGIPPAIADSIFAPFVSGRDNGTGLGLALVSKIISQLGGTIACLTDRKLTTFRISLPLAPAKEI